MLPRTQYRFTTPWTVETGIFLNFAIFLYPIPRSARRAISRLVSYLEGVILGFIVGSLYERNVQ